jgi:hypothetical protein
MSTICLLLAPALFFAFLDTVQVKADVKAEVKVANGAIILVSPSGAERKLTRGPSDSDPSVTPDGKHVVFVRNFQGSRLPPSAQPRPQSIRSEILRVGFDGGQLEVLFSGRVRFKQFAYDTYSSPKGRYLYFLVPLEAVSDGLVRLNLATGDLLVIMAAQRIVVLDKGRYKGFLIVQRRIQGSEGAAYPFWLLTPAGHPVRQIGNDDAVTTFIRDQL